MILKLCLFGVILSGFSLFLLQLKTVVRTEVEGEL